MGLIDSKEKRAEMSYAISIIKKDFLWSWQERIDREMRLLQSVVSANNSN
jgi:hypothetical protein